MPLPVAAGDPRRDREDSALVRDNEFVGLRGGVIRSLNSLSSTGCTTILRSLLVLPLLGLLLLFVEVLALAFC